MNEELKEQLNRIEEYVVLAAKNVLNIEDVCLLTGLSKARVYALCSQREIPHYKQGKLYFKRSEVEAWLTSKRVKTQAEIESKAALYCYEHKA